MIVTDATGLKDVESRGRYRGGRQRGRAEERRTGLDRGHLVPVAITLGSPDRARFPDPHKCVGITCTVLSISLPFLYPCLLEL